MQSLPSFFSTLTRWLWQCAYQKQAIRLLEGDGFQTRQSPRPLLRRTRPRHPIIGEKTTLATLLKKTLPGEWLTRSGSLHLQHASFPVKQKTICSHWLGRRDLTGWRPVGLSGQYGDWIRRRVLKGLGNNRLPPHLAQKMRPFPASSRVCKFLLFCSGYKS